MYFQGNWSSVKFDDVKSLAQKGTDILFIEKMGIVEIFTEHADKYDMTIVNTQGLLTEYGKDLMRHKDKVDMWQYYQTMTIMVYCWLQKFQIYQG